MKIWLRVYVTLSLTILSACAPEYFYQHQQYVNEKAPQFGSQSFPNLPLFARINEIAQNPQNVAISEYNALGFKAAYYDSPKLFLLCADSEMVMVFSGSEVKDFATNLYYVIHTDKPENESTFYIPSGHGGFRREISDLVSNGFIQKRMRNFAKECDPQAGKLEPISIYLTGHSLGAGLAIMSAPSVDDWRYDSGMRTHWSDNSEYDQLKNEHPVVSGKDYKPKFKVKQIVVFATPLAIARESTDDSWQWMNEKYGNKIFNVIREDDPIPFLFPFWANNGKMGLKQIGKYYRIDVERSKITRVNTNWESNATHSMRCYREDIYKLLRNAETTSSEGEKPCMLQHVVDPTNYESTDKLKIDDKDIKMRFDE